ncbi:NUDIX hydrolase [Aliikangiella coralliicola]|uniref:CoA pyrophosphatase n=1 Tax=Aliikangiella coralliicola TaxID=2592383 RepID=A0A545U509_9GAMM|nr:CoA pyrophosphatase [Aliikangiella coralliicola]TQV84556.1 CoA pyrophosphatase [Aliikangiella coralliicola]
MIEKIQSILLPLSTPSESSDSLKCAAVLMPIVKNSHSGDWEVIFTRRAEHLKHHPGQISFPGGGYEVQDDGLGDTAIRETFEEIGISPKQIQLIGRLPQQQTISQYNVTPYVGIIDPDYQLAIDDNEVAEVFTAPFSFVTDQTNQKKVEETIKGKQYSFYVIQYKHYNIWGATAKILVNFTRRLNRDEN